MAESAKHRIYMFANFGRWDSIPFGGGEVGNRRTLNLLRKADFDVVTISKYQRSNFNSRTLRHLASTAKMPFCILKFFVVLFFGRRRNSIVHIVGFSGNMIFFEGILIDIAKILGFKTVYELRGGGAANFYKRRGSVYRHRFRTAISRADSIFLQSADNKDVIKTINNDSDLFYYPNYVMPNFIPDKCPSKPTDSLHLIYFGRVVPTKHIDIVIDTLIIISQKHPNATLDIIGDYLDSRYYNSLKKMVADKNLTDRIKFRPACNQELLSYYLSDKHFFILPSTEEHEGHSNSMTEAMAWGIIPITTHQGCNHNILNHNNLITDKLSADSFADIILSITENGEIPQLSADMYNRVSNNYHYNLVYKQVKEKYELLFSKWFNPSIS